MNQSDSPDWNGIFNYHTDQVGPFQLNIQCRSGQVRLIGIEYSVVIWIGWAHSDSIFNAGLDRLAWSELNIQWSYWSGGPIPTQYSMQVRANFAVFPPPERTLFSAFAQATCLSSRHRKLILWSDCRIYLSLEHCRMLWQACTVIHFSCPLSPHFWSIKW
jgi:hypothetical protein